MQFVFLPTINFGSQNNRQQGHVRKLILRRQELTTVFIFLLTSNISTHFASQLHESRKYRSCQDMLAVFTTEFSSARKP